jgi:hypothetical protein
MRFDNRAADAKSHACAVSLGGKEGVKDLICLVPGQSHPGIADRQQQFIVFAAT